MIYPGTVHDLLCVFCNAYPYTPDVEDYAYPQSCYCEVCQAWIGLAESEKQASCLKCKQAILPETCAHGHVGYNLYTDSNGDCVVCDEEKNQAVDYDDCKRRWGLRDFLPSIHKIT